MNSYYNQLQTTFRKLSNEKLNENTAFIDGSVIYGSSFADMDHLLDHENGHLRRTLFNGQAFPPFSEQAIYDQIYRRFKEVDLFEARKIVGAQMQVIAYRDWLPILLGSDLAPYGGYDPGVDPSISVEFAFGAMRVGHALLRDKTLHATSDGRQSALPTEDDVLRIEKVLFDGGVDTFLNGLMGMSIKRPQFLSPSITERIFGGMDLGAINIQRARDAAVSSYNEARSLCSLSKASTFNDLSSGISNPETRSMMEKLYASPDDIDLYVGLLSEDPSSGLLGPTSACLIADQFKRLRDGDRFFFKNPGIFTNDQLIEIEKTSLSKIICDNADRISLIGTDAFSLSSSQVPCDRLPTIDLTKWEE
uniref:Peroxidase n=1 Tax=Romanomermis culicivorax TaxID=13658 RepID=A0A915KR58_ROMCU